MVSFYGSSSHPGVPSQSHIGKIKRRRPIDDQDVTEATDTNCIRSRLNIRTINDLAKFENLPVEVISKIMRYCSLATRLILREVNPRYKAAIDRADLTCKAASAAIHNENFFIPH